jgi:hypothetical protein
LGTGYAFLKRHPKSPWSAALFTGLGIEYYAHYSLALDAWRQGLSREAKSFKEEAAAVLG